MAFTDYETEQLRKALLKETRHCAVTLGMKKTSVEQLTKAVLAVCPVSYTHLTLPTNSRV